MRRQERTIETDGRISFPSPVSRVVQVFVSRHARALGSDLVAVADSLRITDDRARADTQYAASA